MRRSLAVIGTLFAALLVLLGAAPANADLDDFSYDSWDVRYELSLDGHDRAVAHVTETLVARFPDFNQNKGIVRALPLRYERAPAAPENVSITDGAGKEVPFTIEDDNQFRAILVGDDDFVHGVQTYVISYTIHDVVIAASETKVDEFYWDILPLERAQPIERFTAQIDFSPELASRLTGVRSCYTGPAYATEPCDLTNDAAASSFVIPPMQVPSGSGLTVAIALEPGTVVQPPERLPDFALDGLPTLIAGGAAATGLAGAIAVSGLRRKRRTFRGTIVAQYEVPPHLPPLIAAPLVRSLASPVAAEFVHLAVNGVMRIEEAFSDNGKSLSGKPKLRFRLLDSERAFDSLDQRMTSSLFPTLAAGEVFDLPKRSTKFAEQMQRVQAYGVSESMNREYFTREHSRLGRLLALASLLVLIPAIVLLVQGATREMGPTRFFAYVLIGVTALTALIGFMSHKVYTPLGAETREYLLGVQEFIRVAEADRLQMLQSYSGAERREDGTVNVVHLYEKLLPYAMLFKLEKEWGKALQVQYEQERISAPAWYPGVALSHASLGDSLTAFTSTLSSSASYSSSSSGGSSGGGFSGGGGGGGFSGGR